MNLEPVALEAMARAKLPEFFELVANVPYERKGIPNSEMFFLWLCSHTVVPSRIIESGRARGQSTLVLARIFPNSEIISIEHDRNSPDVEVAADRLKDEPNVRLLFGDATKLLPELVKAGDIVLIDGPKGFCGIRLAMKLLASGKLPMVFLHDVGSLSRERRFIERCIPDFICSDQPEFVAVSHALDDEEAIDIPPAHRFAATVGKAGYGYGLAYLPFKQGTSYRALWAMAIFTSLFG